MDASRAVVIGAIDETRVVSAVPRHLVIDEMHTEVLTCDHTVT